MSKSPKVQKSNVLTLCSFKGVSLDEYRETLQESYYVVVVRTSTLNQGCGFVLISVANRDGGLSSMREQKPDSLMTVIF